MPGRDLVGVGDVLVDDLRLLGSQRVTRLARQPAHGLPGGEQRAPGTLGEPLRADAREQLVGRAQLLARNSACARAWTPSAQSVPPARVIGSRRANASAARRNLRAPARVRESGQINAEQQSAQPEAGDNPPPPDG
jgi:hypothetical protein